MVASVVILASQRGRASLCRYFPAVVHHRVILLESAHPENAPVTRLESALPKSLDLKPFRIRTYENWRGEGDKMLTRNSRQGALRTAFRNAFRRFLRNALQGVGALAPTSSGRGNWALAPEETLRSQVTTPRPAPEAQARHSALTQASIPITGVLKSRLRIGHVA